ncbi:hypothetical protein VPH35_081773 [Triticum aestivum]
MEYPQASERITHVPGISLPSLLHGHCEVRMEMKERQRWRPEEDAILRSYVRQYGPREWNLVAQRMNVPLDRDAKSCLERWKNYLRPGIKKGSLTDDEQRLVIRLQAKHGNKWKKIAAEVPGRTAKRLGKWWEVFKEKQQREIRDSRRPPPEPSPDERGRYEWLLENFAEKLVKERQQRVVATYQAAGRCPYCGGGVVATDVESAPRLCYVPLCFRVRRRFHCSLCSRRLASIA